MSLFHREREREGGGGGGVLDEDQLFLKQTDVTLYGNTFVSFLISYFFFYKSFCFSCF